MKEIAVYGKGGIGKSTISANLSAALSLQGSKVLQIGCDPKHDSTRLLLHGQKIVTVLDYLRVTKPLDYDINAVLFHGFNGIGCVEAGGPKPGVGCAGRGIISTFELLDQFHVKANYDLVVYDVLGDVVCGGFAVPIRQEYADTIFLVTSGEYMALYAANNILRGIRNYDREKKRVAGILYNRRNIAGEDERVARFAKAVHLPVSAVIPRDDAFARSEQENRTVVESGDAPQLREIFLTLAQAVLSQSSLFAAMPLSDEELEQTVLGTVRLAAVPQSLEAGAAPAAAPGGVKLAGVANPNRILSKNMVHNEPLYGCAFNGAANTCVHLEDVAVLAHSPKSCTYLSYQSISSPGRRALFERGALLSATISPNFVSTDMNEADMIFGGADKLEEKVREVKRQKPKAIVVISACPAGIIGDDIDAVKALAAPDMPIIPIKADGNLAGDYLQGMLMSYTALARQIIDRSVAPVPDTVNIVFEKVVAKNTESNFAVIESFLQRMGIGVNCRFLCRTRYDRLKNFLSAPLNLLAYKDYTGKILEDFFTKEYGCRFLTQPFPVGFMETKEWLWEVASVFGKEQQVEELIADHERQYEEEIAALKPVLAGKKLMIITYNHQLDWILETAFDLGMDVVKIGVLNFSQDDHFVSNLGVPLNLELQYDRDNREKDIAAYRPDILLTNYASSLGQEAYVADTIPTCPDVGFFSGLLLAKRWATLIKLNLRGEWRDDERLFKKYYA